MKLNFNILVLILSFSLACVPERNENDPRNYDMFVEISKDSDPAESPDGNWIAYCHFSLITPIDTIYPTGLYLIDSEGNNRKLLYEGYCSGPTWSPDGKKVAFINSDQIVVLNLEDNFITMSGPVNNVPLNYPDFSNNGEMIIFSSPDVNSGGLFFSDTSFNKIVHYMDNVDFLGLYAQWTPDGRIIYESADTQEVMILDTIHNNKIRITHDNKDDRTPRMSLDSSMIITSKGTEIILMDLNGNTLKFLDYGRYPFWSYDSEHVYYSFANKDGKKAVIWKINIYNNTKHQITD